jgi:hypothetical protein
MEVSAQLHAPADLPLGKEPQVPIGYEAGWAPEPVQMQWGTEKSLAPARNQTSAIQSVACPYTASYRGFF